MAAVSYCADRALGCLGGLVPGGGWRPAGAAGGKSLPDQPYREHRRSWHLGQAHCGHPAGGGG